MKCFERLVRIHLMKLFLTFVLTMFSVFRSIFSDDTDHVISINEDKFDNRLLFTSWISRKVQQFLKILSDDLEVIIASDWFTLNFLL